MEPRKQKTFARVVLVLFVAACAGWIARLDFARKISTNVLDLLPNAEQSPEAALVRSLADDAQARVMLFGVKSAAAPTTTGELARDFAAALRASGQFAEAVPMTDDAAKNQMGRAIFERRFSLLLPTWLAQKNQEFAATNQPRSEFSAWLAERTAAELEAFLARPEALPMQDLVQSDPLLLVPNLLRGSGELATAGQGKNGEALVWGLMHASPLAEAGQGPVFAAIEQATAGLRMRQPDVAVRWTGVNRFAAASRARIEGEFSWLNTLSLLAVLAVGCAFVRRVWKLLHLVPVILCSLLGAWTVSTLVFDRIHILVFVIGSLLSGVAVDYGFYIYMQPSRRPDESYDEKLRRLLKPLLASCLTTVIGFSLLLFSDLPLLREVGFFVGVGLLCALGAAMLYFAQLDRPFLETRRFEPALRVAQRTILHRFAPLLLLGILVIAAVGLQRMRWRDDIHDLEIPSTELHANDEALRAAFGESGGRTAYITHGATASEARQHLEDFLAFTRTALPPSSAVTLGTLFPTEANWHALPAALAGLGAFGGDLSESLQRHGFEADSFEPFFKDWETFRTAPAAKNYTELYRELKPQLTGPLALLYRAEAPLSWFLTLVDQPVTKTLPPSLNTLPVNQLESLNGLFTRYRWSALRLSLIGLTLVIVSVFVIYRGRQALRIAAIPAGSCFFVFGLFGLAGQTLNLFHLLGAFLGVCLSHNYAIFSTTVDGQGAVPPVSIRISALCTAASFGVLGLSHIAVIHALGTTVALIVLTALATIEWESLQTAPAK